MRAEHLLECRRLRGVVEQSRGAVRVDVADVPGRKPAVLEREPDGARRLAPVGTWRGHVIGVVREAVAHQLGVELRSAGQRPIALLEHEHRGPLAHHEAVACLVERARRVGRIVVARAHGADHAERRVGHGRERRLGAARQHHVGPGLADRMERVADRDRARGAAHGVGRVRAREAELDGDVAARGAGKHGERERGIEPARALREEAPHLRLRERHAAQRRAHHGADPIGVLACRVELRVGEGEPGARHRELGEAIEPLGALRGEVVLGPEVGDLGRDAALERRRIEAGDLPDRRAARGEPLPQPVCRRADRGHGAHAGDDHSPPTVVHLGSIHPGASPRGPSHAPRLA